MMLANWAFLVSLIYYYLGMAHSECNAAYTKGRVSDVNAASGA